MISRLKAGVHAVFDRLRPLSSADYWERRYLRGGNSGVGSYGQLAQYKAAFINDFVSANAIQSVVDFGCGDGNQLRLANYPKYLGLDVSRSAVERLTEQFKGDPSKHFQTLPAEDVPVPDAWKADCALSLDVIYHLIEDDAYRIYMRRLFEASRKFVVIYSSDFESPTRAHIRHRHFSEFVAVQFPEFALIRAEPNPHPALTSAGFFIFQRRSTGRLALTPSPCV